MKSRESLDVLLHLLVLLFTQAVLKRKRPWISLINVTNVIEKISCTFIAYLVFIDKDERFNGTILKTCIKHARKINLNGAEIKHKALAVADLLQKIKNIVSLLLVNLAHN